MTAVTWCSRNSADGPIARRIGGAIVFSCGALHEVTPITRGRRYAFLPFLYGEEDAARREKNNANIVQTEFRYAGEVSDRLFPEEELPRERRAG